MLKSYEVELYRENAERNENCAQLLREFRRFIPETTEQINQGDFFY